MKTENVSVDLNPNSNGGEAITLNYKIVAHEGEKPFIEQVTLETWCYGTSSSSISMFDVLDSDQLRDIANQLDQAKARLTAK